MKKASDSTLQIIALGLISGLRATFAPAITAHYLHKQPSLTLANSKLAFMQSPAAAVITKIIAASEIVTDKLPNTPNRIVPPQVIARVVSGAFAGVVLSEAKKDNLLKGGLLGGAVALAATYASYYSRKYVSTNSVIKEPMTGVAEDIFGITVGVLTMS